MIHRWLEYLIIRKSMFFDAHYYLQHNPDVRRADIDPLLHFIDSGWKEERNPGPAFDTHYYLASNPDVRDNQVNPLFHYLQYGQYENRLPRPYYLASDTLLSAGETLISQGFPDRSGTLIPSYNGLWLNNEVLETISSLLR